MTETREKYQNVRASTVSQAPVVKRVWGGEKKRQGLRGDGSELLFGDAVM